jgi:hypothetical protein
MWTKKGWVAMGPEYLHLGLTNIVSFSRPENQSTRSPILKIWKPGLECAPSNLNGFSGRPNER